ncbi:MAG: phosphoribosylformylglycinamidine synthase subunit PurS [Thermoplasmata archaeon]|nr:phosphoribosylformylglycinamidine synthase subunit PurS [Thermoplasmata archaeon]
MEKYTVEVKVELKKGVTDPEGENTKKALALLGFNAIESVRSLRVYELMVSAETKEKAIAIAEESCRKLLANPVIHNYKIMVKEL